MSAEWGDAREQAQVFAEYQASRRIETGGGSVAQHNAWIEQMTPTLAKKLAARRFIVVDCSRCRTLIW